MPPQLDLAPRDAGPLHHEPAIEFHLDAASHHSAKCPETLNCGGSSSEICYPTWPS